MNKYLNDLKEKIENTVEDIEENKYENTSE